MIINGVELPNIDKYDLETAKKVEEIEENLKSIADKVRGLKRSKSIEIQCNAIFNVFNTLFGEGTDKKIFGDKVNLKTCFLALDQLLTEVRQDDEEDEELKRVAAKYTPNRAQKRAKK